MKNITNEIQKYGDTVIAKIIEIIANRVNDINAINKYGFQNILYNYIIKY
jgi:hypothetical protein